MTRKNCVGGTRAPAATILVCLAVLAVPATSVAAQPGGSAGPSHPASEPLAPGAGYAQPQGDPRVRALQRRLRALGLRPGPVDGLYGPLTAEAVERLQRDSGLAVDGIVGPRTRRVLNAAAPPLVPGAGFGQPGGSRQVRAVQRRLRSLGERPGPIDGLYGPRTRAAIERFQRDAGRRATGVLSPAAAVALARADGDPAPTSAPAAQADRDRGRAGEPTGSKTRSTEQVEVRGEAADEGGSASPLSWAAAALALLILGGLLVRLIGGRRSRPEPTGAAAVSDTPIAPPANGTAPAPHAAPTTQASRAEGETAAGQAADRRRATELALGYLSVRDPERANGHEVEEQMAAIEMACRNRGLELTEVVRDAGRVGATGPERPGMQHALHRLDAGGASCMVVAELDRLGPSPPEVGSIVESLRRRETRLVAADEGLDTGTSSGSKAADELVSQYAATDRQPSVPPDRPEQRRPPRPSERTSHRGPPDEYDVAALKQRIRAMRAAGMTLQAIADRLNAENVPTIRGGVKWRPSSVQAAAGYRRPQAEASTPGVGAQPPGGPAKKRHGKSRKSSSGRRGGRRR